LLSRPGKTTLSLGEFFAHCLNTTFKLRKVPVSCCQISCELRLQLRSLLVSLGLKLGPSLPKAGPFRSQPVTICGQRSDCLLQVLALLCQPLLLRVRVGQFRLRGALCVTDLL
jgi:hypothetical protein